MSFHQSLFNELEKLAAKQVAGPMQPKPQIPHNNPRRPDGLDNAMGHHMANVFRDPAPNDPSRLSHLGKRPKQTQQKLPFPKKDPELEYMKHRNRLS